LGSQTRNDLGKRSDHDRGDRRMANRLTWALMKLWPRAVATAFILISGSESSSYLSSRAWGTFVLGVEVPFLGVAKRVASFKEKGETTGFEDRPEAPAEISLVLGEKGATAISFSSPAGAPRSWPQIALQRSFIASEIGASLPIFGACPSPDPVHPTDSC